MFDVGLWQPGGCVCSTIPNCWGESLLKRLPFVGMALILGYLLPCQALFASASRLPLFRSRDESKIASYRDAHGLLRGSC